MFNHNQDDEIEKLVSEMRRKTRIAAEMVNSLESEVNLTIARLKAKLGANNQSDKSQPSSKQDVNSTEKTSNQTNTNR